MTIIPIGNGNACIWFRVFFNIFVTVLVKKTTKPIA